MKKITLYVEGGGDSKEQHARCREGFRKLLEKADYSNRLPRIFAGGSRNNTFRSFKIALRSAQEGECPMLLVDSENPLAYPAMLSWDHLKVRDKWDRPPGATDDQAQLMVTCMETWIIADRSALRSFFGTGLHEAALVPVNDLETKDRQIIQDALYSATKDCVRRYCKGDRSFQLLSGLHPDTLKLHLPHFMTFIDALNKILKANH